MLEKSIQGKRAFSNLWVTSPALRIMTNVVMSSVIYEGCRIMTGVFMISVIMSSVFMTRDVMSNTVAPLRERK